MTNDTAPTGLDPALTAAIAAIELGTTPPEKSGTTPPEIPGTTPAAAVAIDYQAQAVDLIEFAYALTSPWWPALENVYPPAVRKRLAAVTGPLMRKYGFNLDDFGPELGFAIVALPLVGPTVQAIKAGGPSSPPPAADKRPVAETPPDRSDTPDFSHGFR